MQCVVHSEKKETAGQGSKERVSTNSEQNAFLWGSANFLLIFFVSRLSFQKHHLRCSLWLIVCAILLDLDKAVNQNRYVEEVRRLVSRLGVFFSYSKSSFTFYHYESSTASVAHRVDLYFIVPFLCIFCSCSKSWLLHSAVFVVRSQLQERCRLQQHNILLYEHFSHMRYMLISNERSDI